MTTPTVTETSTALEGTETTQALIVGRRHHRDRRVRLDIDAITQFG